MTKQNTKNYRICIITGELAGPDVNGGIGTANRGLAFALHGVGFDVDILYTRVNDGRPFSFRGSFGAQVDEFRDNGIELKCIRHDGSWNDWCAKSYRALQHLLKNNYDLVFFDDTHGNAYFPLIAKTTGNSKLRSTKICVVAHSATQWIVDANESALTSLEEIRLLEMERRSIELADVVVAPSKYILSRYRGFGWRLPEKTEVQPNIVFSPASTKFGNSRRFDVREIVFFGRLEARKGLWLFCRALDRLKHQLDECGVTFLGKFTYEGGLSTAAKLLRRSAAWPFEIRILHDYDREQALNYLKGDGRLAVMPSREDNSPSVILECLDSGIPFLASSGSGGEELLDARSREACLFEPTVRGLADKIAEVRTHGTTTGASAVSFDENRANYISFVQSTLTDERGQANSGTSTELGRVNDRPEPFLIIVAPENAESAQVESEIKSIVERYSTLIEIEVISNTHDAAPTRLSFAPDNQRINIRKPSEFADLCHRLTLGNDRTVGICHLTQPISPEWFDRAEIAFSANAEIAAVTGLVVDKNERNVGELPPYFSFDAAAHNVDRFVVGNAAAVFPLFPDTNRGFAAFRSRCLSMLADHSPIDPQYGRMKLMEHWIHELLMSLCSFGERFELIVDLALTSNATQRTFEVYTPGNFMRSLVRSQFGYKNGSDQALLSRLAIDTSLGEARMDASLRCIEAAAKVLGEEEIDWTLTASRHDQVNALSRLAMSVGQIELATELSSSVVLPSAYNGITSGEYLELAAREISLHELVVKNEIERINLNEDWSFRVFESGREFELHANAADMGRATLKFNNIDLADVDTFLATLHLPEGGQPVRCRVDIVTCDRSEQTGHEVTLRGGESREVVFELPDSTKKKCDILLSVEMMSMADETVGAHVRWLDARLSCTTVAETGNRA